MTDLRKLDLGALRDQCAMLVLEQLLASNTSFYSGQPDTAAKLSYKLADAMMIERERGE